MHRKGLNLRRLRIRSTEADAIYLTPICLDMISSGSHVECDKRDLLQAYLEEGADIHIRNSVGALRLHAGYGGCVCNPDRINQVSCAQNTVASVRNRLPGEHRLAQRRIKHDTRDAQQRAAVGWSRSRKPLKTVDESISVLVVI